MPMTEMAVVAQGLSKRYPLWPSPWSRLFEATTGRRRHQEFTALADVSFELRRGESLGLIGENGAGKSTLLKIVAGVASPTSGSVEVEGRVTSILELGSGFHPEFTGRQNIVLNAALLGLSEREVERHLPHILEFSELGEFIDQPVKTYSTGMAMRLGFAVATSVDPDVLIIDEALSVGDGYFQKKCMDRMQEFIARGGTLLFCSHAMFYISAFCQRALWLRQGRVEAFGAPAEVVQAYEHHLLERRAPATSGAVVTRDGATADDSLPGPARITAVCQPRTAAAQPTYSPNDPFELDIEWESEDASLGFHLAVGVNRADEIEVLTFATAWSGLPPIAGGHRHALRLTVPRLPLMKGEFTLYVYLLDGAALHVFDRWVIRPAFSMVNSRYAFGQFWAEHEWLPQAAPARTATPVVDPRRA